MRFVIQHHINESEHYDLMIENNSGALITWKIGKRDIDMLLDGAVIQSERIQYHRKEYLDYEGPVSNGRGSVMIFDKGECEVILKNDDRFEYKMRGGVLAGNILITKIEGMIFRVHYMKNL